jgi:hypothetical protein
MKATIERADASFEVAFKKPLLDQSRGAPLQKLYDALSENFTLSLADITVNAGPAPAQAFANVALFGGAGSIEIRMDRWRATFRGLRTPEDTKVISRCLELAEGALACTRFR